MKPILILQHLERGDVPLMMEALKPTGLESVTLRPDLGEPLPEPQDLQSFSGLCFCGGTQSVNDDYPWIAQELDLIRYAAEIDMPVIGHCLGGQLISAALGGTVSSFNGDEFGWQLLQHMDNDVARRWLGEDGTPFVAMQWHNDTFTIPPGATQILSGEHCHNQAFVSGNMLGMQFHVEMVESSVRYWAEDLAHDAPEPGPMVQTPAEILDQLETNMAISRSLGMRLYNKWLEAVL